MNPMTSPEILPLPIEIGELSTAWLNAALNAWNPA